MKNPVNRCDSKFDCMSRERAVKHHPNINISVELQSLSVSSYESLPEFFFSQNKVISI